MPKKYRHLMKPLTLKEGPAGLYPFPLFWMEAKDMEGFNASFAYAMVKEPCKFHPLEGMLVHPYDEVLVFASLDPANILNLGAEIAIVLGEEREEYIFDQPTVVTIPKGLAHGPVEVRRVDRPFAHYSGGLGPAYQADTVQELANPVNKNGSKYAHLVKRLVTDKNYKSQSQGSGMGYESMLDERGVMLPNPSVGQGNADELVWLFGKDLNGFELNLTWGHYSKNGKWHRASEMHTHPTEEILIFVGMDPDNPEYLGAELELGMGIECERHIFHIPTIAVCPQSFPHLPLITRWVDQPYGFIVFCLDGEHDSPWVNIDPDDI